MVTVYNAVTIPSVAYASINWIIENNLKNIVTVIEIHKNIKQIKKITKKTTQIKIRNKRI